MNEHVPPERAPQQGMIWQCIACGKRAEDRYGFVGWRSPGWDESCMMNAMQVPDTRPAIADQSPQGRDAERLDAKHASGGARSAIAQTGGPTPCK